MPDHEALYGVLRRFARTMTGRYDITDVLYELCDEVVGVLHASGAGVGLFDEDGALQFVTATDQRVVAAEKEQERLQEGPCFSAIEQRHPVVVTDIRCHDEWPDYRRAAGDLGLHAVVGVPLVLDDDRIGSLGVYNAAPRTWSHEQVGAATVLADVAAAYVLNASELARTRRTAEQLETALDSRVVIEQAKGKLAGQLGMTLDQAFAALRRHARSNNLQLRHVARAVLDHGVDALRERTATGRICPGTGEEDGSPDSGALEHSALADPLTDPAHRAIAAEGA